MDKSDEYTIDISLINPEEKYYASGQSGAKQPLEYHAGTNVNWYPDTARRKAQDERNFLTSAG